MANATHSFDQRSTHGNQKAFAELRDASGPFGDIGVNDGSYFHAKEYWVRYVCEVSSGKIGATTLAAAGTQEIDLHVAFPNQLMPENILIKKCLVNVLTLFAGATTITVSVGDTGNPDEWMDALDVLSGSGSTGVFDDLADADAVRAAGGDDPLETAYVPTLTIDTTVEDVSDITAGKLEILFLVTEVPV